MSTIENEVEFLPESLHELYNNDVTEYKSLLLIQERYLNLHRIGVGVFNHEYTSVHRSESQEYTKLMDKGIKNVLPTRKKFIINLKVNVFVKGLTTRNIINVRVFENLNKNEKINLLEQMASEQLVNIKNSYVNIKDFIKNTPELRTTLNRIETREMFSEFSKYIYPELTNFHTVKIDNSKQTSKSMKLNNDNSKQTSNSTKVKIDISMKLNDDINECTLEDDNNKCPLKDDISEHTLKDRAQLKIQRKLDFILQLNTDLKYKLMTSLKPVNTRLLSINSIEYKNILINSDKYSKLYKNADVGIIVHYLLFDDFVQVDNLKYKLHGVEFMNLLIRYGGYGCCFKYISPYNVECLYSTKMQEVLKRVLKTDNFNIYDGILAYLFTSSRNPGFLMAVMFKNYNTLDKCERFLEYMSILLNYYSPKYDFSTHKRVINEFYNENINSQLNLRAPLAPINYTFHILPLHQALYLTYKPNADRVIHYETLWDDEILKIILNSAPKYTNEILNFLYFDQKEKIMPIRSSEVLWMMRNYERLVESHKQLYLNLEIPEEM